MLNCNKLYCEHRLMWHHLKNEIKKIIEYPSVIPGSDLNHILYLMDKMENMRENKLYTKEHV